ncbi:MAG: lipase family protein [Deltaproteobacteria bacterium]|nr:lipase family protein [Deltaproteobacteria bacterium]
MARTFNHKAFGFDPTNAVVLAEAAKLVYGDKSAVASTVQAWGFPHFEWFENNDTQAFLCGDTVKLILAFRGTEPTDLRDWVTDARIYKTHGPGGDVHSGFARALGYVWHDVEGAVHQWRDHNQTLWLTGHSLGAALATLAAASLRLRDAAQIVNGVYTFGQPRVGSQRFAQNFNSALKGQAFRFVNNNDVVTRVPLSSQDYSHVGTLRYFDNEGKLHSDDDLSWWGTFWDRIDGALEELLDKKIAAIADHAMDRYEDLTRKNCP